MTLSFHVELRDAHRELWEAMQAHRFIRAIEADALDYEPFVRYLAYEQDFVEAAIVIFGCALVKAPDFAARRHLIGVLHTLAEEQVGYFQDTFRDLGATPLSPALFPPAVVLFREGMLGIAREGSYAEVIAAMLAAEWMYATWCMRAASAQITDAHLRRWVDLHAAPAFGAQVQWLQAEIDRLAAVMTKAEREVVSVRFSQALVFEIAFHEAPFV